MKSRILQDILIIGCILLHFQINSQHYFNKAIPFGPGLPTTVDLHFDSDNYMVFAISPSDSSMVISLNDDGSSDIKYFDGFNFSENGFIKIDQCLFSFIRLDTLAKGINLVQFDTLLNIQRSVSVKTKGESHFSAYSTSIDDYLFNGINLRENGIRKFGIAKFDKDLNNLWTHYYESDIAYAYLWTMEPTSDNNLIIGYNYRKVDTWGTDAYISKIDLQGNVIWRSPPMDSFKTSSVNVIELSNGNMLVNYVKDIWDVSTTQTEHPYPPTFVFLDPDGNILMEKYVYLPRDQNIEIRHIVKGKEDYFFAFGFETFYTGPNGEENYYGFITKYDNNGEEIWHKNYRHPEFNGIYNFHEISRFEELENGDLVGTGEIFIPNSLPNKPHIWFLKVDKNGCFTEEHCDDSIQILTSTEEVSKEDKLLLYPNPVVEHLYVNTSEPIQSIEIKDLVGRSFRTNFNLSNQSIDVSDLLPGLYILSAQSDSGIFARQFYKQ